MKANYNSLLQTYESNYEDILRIATDGLEIATEADSTPTEINASSVVKDTVSSDEKSAMNKTNLITKVIERVKEFIKKIAEMCDTLKRKMSNRLRLMMETDKGFQRMYYKRKSMIKPYKSVQVITYQYVDQVLDQPMDKLLNEVSLCLEKLRAIEGTSNNSSRITEIIDAPQGKMIEILFEPYTKQAETPVTNVQEFIRYIVERYRGEKKEIVFQDTQLQQIESHSSSASIAAKSNAYLKQAQEAYNKIKVLEYQIKRSETDTKIINLVATNASKAAILYNAYSALINAYYELKLEQCLNYRIILKKFYQF